MMTLEELEKKLTELDDFRSELKTQIAKLKAQNKEKPTPPHKMWKPEFQERYYDTAFGNSCYTFVDGEYDHRCYNLGLMYKTKEKAKEEAERLKTLKKMREWAGEWNDPWAILYDGCQVEAISVGGKDVTYGELRFATKEDAQNCIKSVGEDRIKKYYFRIPDDKEGEKTDDRE